MPHVFPYVLNKLLAMVGESCGCLGVLVCLGGACCLLGGSLVFMLCWWFDRAVVACVA